MAYDFADPVPLSFNTTDASGAPANAGSVTLTIYLPDGSSTATPTVNNPSPGLYTAVYQPTQTGLHQVKWVATGVNANGFSDAFDVYYATPSYIISLADARAQLRLTATTSDEELRPYIEATTAVIERHVNEAIARRVVVEDYKRVVPSSVLHPSSIALRTTPVISLTSVVSTNYPYTWDVTALHLDPITGLVTSLPQSWPLWGDLTATYVAGRSIVPANYLQAARIIVQHLWQTKRGAAGTQPPGGMQDSMHLSGRLGWGYAIPNAAIELLGYGMSGIA